MTPPAWAPHLPPGLDAAPLDLHGASSLSDAFRVAWRHAGSARGSLQDLDGHWLTGAELEERTAAAALRLAAAGLRTGDRLILCAPTSAALVIAYVAALRAGLVVAPLNPGYTRPEVERVVRAAGPAAALVADDQHARWIAGAAERPVAVGGIDLAGLPAGGAGRDAALDAALDAAGLEHPALLLYTSGTTGAPKGALLTHGNLLASARAVGLAWRWTPEDRLLLTLPLFHMHGLGVGINGGLAAGGQIVLRPGFDAGDVARHAAAGATMFFGVPTMYDRLVSRGGPAAALRPLRLLVSGSAPLAPALARAVADAAGQLPLERYGMTETVMLTSNPIDGPRRPGSVGLPLPGVELRLSDAVEQDGGVGEVEVRGPNVLRGYDPRGYDQRGGRAADDADAFTPDGWFRTGDLGRLDADGYLWLVGRSKELIISGGFNVYPREVEEALAAFPGVREVAVVGRPSDRWGEAVTAVVVPDTGVPVPDPEALRRFAAERLAPYKIPKTVEFVDSLPRNALGKVIRGAL